MKPEDPNHPPTKDEALTEPAACGTRHLDGKA
jgi:hypothetical protein